VNLPSRESGPPTCGLFASRIASRNASASIGPARFHQLAPSAARTASSRSRREARTSRRLALPDACFWLDSTCPVYAAFTRHNPRAAVSLSNFLSYNLADGTPTPHVRSERLSGTTRVFVSTSHPVLLYDFWLPYPRCFPFLNSEDLALFRNYQGGITKCILA
jgi:hypothetical protein